MTKNSLTFFFFELKGYGKNPSKLNRALRFKHNSDERYDRYFLSLLIEMPSLRHTQKALAELKQLETKQVSEVGFGGNFWAIHATLDQVIFTNDQFEEWDDGINNIFDYNEFKWILMAWDKFLSMPLGPLDVEYIFDIPQKEILPINSSEIQLVCKSSS